MKFLEPVVITDAMLISSDVPETDYTAWNAATAYVAGDRVIRTSTHRIYERLVNGTTATAPESDPTNWGVVGPTNRWKMFDQAVGSVTEKATSITVTLAPGIVSSLALLDINAASVDVTMTDGLGGPVVFDETYTIEDSAFVDDWADYFFTAPRRRDFLIIDWLPFYSNGHITVTLYETSAAIGSLIVGRMNTIGSTRVGAAVGILDYSVKATDEYGVTSVLERSYAKRIDVPVLVQNSELDYVVERLAAVRATPCVWIASDRRSSLIVYGFYKDWNINIAYADYSEARLSIEGIV